MKKVTENFTELELDTFLDRVAERAPIPGGGAVAATVGALACALARMVAAYSVTKKLGETDRRRVEELAGQLRITDELMRALITQDAAAYERLAEATKDRKTNETAGERAYQAALSGAAAVPLQIVGLAAQTLSTLSDLRPLASPFLLSDFDAATVLCEAAANAAALMVRVNAGSMTDSDRREKILRDLEAMLVRCRTRARELGNGA